jgi:hypothetical protein
LGRSSACSQCFLASGTECVSEGVATGARRKGTATSAIVPSWSKRLTHGSARAVTRSAGRCRACTCWCFSPLKAFPSLTRPTSAAAGSSNSGPPLSYWLRVRASSARSVRLNWRNTDGKISLFNRRDDRKATILERDGTVAAQLQGDDVAVHVNARARRLSVAFTLPLTRYSRR